MDWECPSRGWFILWGLELAAKANPGRAIAIFDGGKAICGFVPDDRTGETLFLETKCPTG
jgi:hypothetical protein